MKQDRATGGYQAMLGYSEKFIAASNVLIESARRMHKLY